jgi:glycosyltransferase involved in cell wall biosynthesis
MIYTDLMVIKTKPSGYSKVAMNLAQRIRDKHHVAHTPMLRSNRMGLFVYQNLLVYPSGDEEFGEDVIEKNCLHFNADAVLTLKDLYVFGKLANLPLEWIPYVPVDGTPIGAGIVNRLRYAFRVLSMSEFGQKELNNIGVKNTLIHHGVGEEYRRFEDRQACRRRFHIKPDEFVIGFVGLNTERKNVSRVLEVIKEARDMNPDVDVKGFLWTNVDKEVPLRGEIIELALNEHVHWPNPDMYDHGLPEENMVELYNCFDLAITVGNEGFWLPGAESLACGVPLIVPDYAAAADRVGPGCGYKVKITEYTMNNPVAIRQPLVDVSDAARKITRIINGDREKYAKRCIQEAEKYRWPKLIEEKWLPFLDSCEEELLPLVKDGKITKWDQTVS